MTNQVIGHVEIPVTDLEKSSNFFIKVFNWDLKSFGRGYYLCNSHKGMTIGLRKVDKVVNGDCTIFHVQVEDIDSVLDKVKAAGGKVVREKTIIPVYGYYALLIDLDGNTIGLYQSNF
jgi:hypothetical protein